jgi:hypothetical protein
VLPPLEDANSIQLAVMMVMDAMLRNRIAPKISGQLLYALQIASCNLRQGVDFRTGEDAKPEDVTRCSSYDSLEADYGIPEHAENLKAASPDARLLAGPDETDEQDQHQAEPLSEVEQFIRHIQGRSYCPERLVPGDPEFEHELAMWRYGKKQQAQEWQRHWENIRRNLAEAAMSEDLEKLKELLEDCYRKAGLQYEGEEWKAAGPQKLLFGGRGNDATSPQPPRKEPEPARADEPAAKTVAGD